MEKKSLMKLELLYGAITRIAPYLCIGARYSPKCELAWFHWKQSWAWWELERPEVYVSAVCSLFQETTVVTPQRPLGWPGIQWDTMCFAVPHQCLSGTSLWKGEGQVVWKLAAGVSIRSNYWLHHLGNFPAFGLLKSHRNAVKCMWSTEFTRVPFFELLVASMGNAG